MGLVVLSSKRCVWGLVLKGRVSVFASFDCCILSVLGSMTRCGEHARKTALESMMALLMGKGSNARHSRKGAADRNASNRRDGNYSKGGGDGKMRCRACNEVGHIKAECSHRHDMCQICDKQGHVAAACFQKPTGGGTSSGRAPSGAGMVCQCCGKEGHTKANCPSLGGGKYMAPALRTEKARGKEGQ